jgi:phage tail sheath gpL-like
MANQPIIGYPSSWKGPFSAVQVLFGQGPSTAGGAKRRTVYYAPKTASGTGVAGKAYPIKRESDAITIGGVGSPGHRMCRMHLMADKDADISLVVYAASSGAGVATATGSTTITMASGTNPTASGLLFSRECGVRLTIGFGPSDDVSTIAANLAAQINQQQHLPYTASATLGVVTRTSKTAGSSSGDGTTGVYRFETTVEAGKNVNVANSGAALGLGSGVAGADGATTELAGLTSALANFAATPFYYAGFSIWSSAAMTVIKSHISNKSEPNPGLRCRAVTGYTGTQAALTTIAIASNFERRHFVWQYNSEHDPAELVANFIAVHRKRESIRRGFVEDNYRQPDWLIQAAASEADWPSETACNDAVVDGISPIASDQFGSRLYMSVTSRSKNAAGTIDDFRSAETHRVSFMDYFGDTWLARDQVQFAGFFLTDDPKNPDGTINRNAKLPPKTLTPDTYRPFVAKIIDQLADEGLLQRREEWKESQRHNIDPENVSRMESSASGRTMDIRHQSTMVLAETTPG